MLKKMISNEKIRWFSSMFLFIGTLAVMVIFIFGAANRYISSESSDTLFWAQASYESKSLINPDFCYPTILPLGGHLLMVPFIALFGLGISAQSWGMLVFMLLFIGSLLFFFRSFRMKYSHAFFFTSFLILMTLISPTMQTFFYLHVLYYSQGLAYLFVGLGILIRTQNALSQEKNKKALTLFMVLSAFMMLTAINGEMTLAIFTVPLLGAYALEHFFSNEVQTLRSKQERQFWMQIIVLFAFVLIGLVIRTLLCAGQTQNYSDRLTSFSIPDDWSQHLNNLLWFWMAQLTQTLGEMKILSKTGILTALQILGGITFAIVPLLALIQYRSFREKWERLAILSHWVMTGIIMFIYTFGVYGGTGWRLIPIIFTSILVTVVYLCHVLATASFPWKRIAGLVAVVLAFNALWSGVNILKLPSDYRTANLYGLAEFLEKNNLSFGYSSYNYANSTTVYSNEKIKVRSVSLDTQEITPTYYLVNRKWYQEAHDSCFLLMTHAEYKLYSEVVPAGYTDLLFYGDDRIFVYDHNIIK